MWGAGNSSHQVEGGNINNDWHEWEQKGKTKDKSGLACDSWYKYENDHELARELNCNSFRLSLEWSRIEPEEGKFSAEAIGHYRKVLQDIKAKGMKRVVTLWHWTLPLWFSHQYGWHRKESVKYFSRYCEKVIQELGDEIDIFITLNEPRLPLNKGYLIGNFPPGKINPFAYFKARQNMVEAHKKCYALAKKIKNDLPVGITQFCNDFDFFGRSRVAGALTEKVEDFYNWHFFTEIGDSQDFIGINYYFGMKISFSFPFVEMQKEGGKVTDMGWGIFSEGIYEVVMDAWKCYRKPIYIFENGIADKKDKYRKDFICDYLKWLHRAISEGADVRGYFYWSLLDNFEWNYGFEKRFGLVEVDFKTQERKIRPSAWEYAKICKNNGLDIELEQD